MNRKYSITLLSKVISWIRTQQFPTDCNDSKNFSNEPNDFTKQRLLRNKLNDIRIYL
jgi:hypothetical protein